MMLVSLLLLSLSLFLSLSSFPSILSIQISPPAGPIDGFTTPLSHNFLGIPFATPPLPPLRFQPPSPLSPWTSPLNASSFSPGCMQSISTSPYGWNPTSASEDCLYLNIYIPLNTSLSSPLLPVGIWIHGGDFITGSGGSLMFDGSQFANHSNVIIVTINYRLGAFGFYFDTENKEFNYSGNVGLLDQRMAFQWVNQNIFAFGGDNTKVTIFGQSAGSVSVSSHLQSETIQASTPSLFSRAISQSNPLGVPLRSFESGTRLSQVFLKWLGCAKNDTKCLQYGKSSSEVLSASATAILSLYANSPPIDFFMSWQPTIGLSAFPLQSTALEYFSTNKVPIPTMIGTVTSEANSFVATAFGKLNLPYFIYEAFVYFFFSGRLYKEINMQYATNRSTGVENNDNHIEVNAYNFLLGSVATDGVFDCPSRNVTSSIFSNFPLSSLYPSPPIYFYRFNHVTATSNYDNTTLCTHSPCHSAELSTLFNSAEILGYPFTKEEEVLSHQMERYWGNFMRWGNPNGNISDMEERDHDILPYWESYGEKGLSNGGNIILDIGDGLRMEHNYRQEECDFWSQTNYDFGTSPMEGNHRRQQRGRREGDDKEEAKALDKLLSMWEGKEGEIEKLKSFFLNQIGLEESFLKDILSEK